MEKYLRIESHRFRLSVKVRNGAVIAADSNAAKSGDFSPFGNRDIGNAFHSRFEHKDGA
jgi:hypothetical protein